MFQIDIVNEVLHEFRREKIADEDALQLQKATKLLREFYQQTLNVTCLFPFYIIMLAFQLSEDFTPSTEIIPILTELITFCESFINASTGAVSGFEMITRFILCFKVVDLAIDLRTNLRSRLLKYTNDDNLLSLMYLDPRFAKDSRLVPTSNHGVIRERIIEWFKPETAAGWCIYFS